MRAVAGSYESMELKQAERDRHIEAVTRFVEQCKGAPSGPCTLIVRSAASGPAQALIQAKDMLLEAGVRAQAIVAKLEPQADLHELFSTLSALSPDAEAGALIRWTRNPRLLEAHEQAVYGTDMTWSGDAMRRDADKRNAMVLFETGAPEATRFASRAFKALWQASAVVPAHHLSAGGAARPCGSVASASVAAMRPQIQGLPLVRH